MPHHRAARWFTLAAFVALVAPGVAAATEAPSTAVRAQDVVGTDAPTRGFVAAQLELLPAGALDLRAPSGTSDAPVERVAYGVSALLARDLLPTLNVGVSPRFVVGLGPAAGEQRAPVGSFELDLRARVTAHDPVVPRVDVFAYAMPGYAWTLRPHAPDDTAFTLGLGGGVALDLAPRAFVSVELGYETALFDERAEASAVHVGLGAGASF